MPADPKVMRMHPGNRAYHLVQFVPKVPVHSHQLTTSCFQLHPLHPHLCQFLLLHPDQLCSHHKHQQIISFCSGHGLYLLCSCSSWQFRSSTVTFNTPCSREQPSLLYVLPLSHLIALNLTSRPQILEVTEFIGSTTTRVHPLSFVTNCPKA